jgi:hypothetical protein
MASPMRSLHIMTKKTLGTSSLDARTVCSMAANCMGVPGPVVLQ